MLLVVGTNFLFQLELVIRNPDDKELTVSTASSPFSTESSSFGLPNTSLKFDGVMTLQNADAGVRRHSFFNSFLSSAKLSIKLET